MSQNGNQEVTFAITFNNEIVGVAGLKFKSDVYRKSAEIGYFIGEPYWNKGIASKAVKLLVKYGFDKLELIRIDTGVIASNKPSCRVLEKCGFKNEGTFKNAIIKNNIISDEVRYGITKC